MEFIAQIHTTGDTVNEHLESFMELVNQSISHDPVLINSQSGKDSWSFAEKRSLQPGHWNFKKIYRFRWLMRRTVEELLATPGKRCFLLKEFNELKLCWRFQSLGLCM